MKKEERIARYGEEAYERRLAQGREYKKAHREEQTAYKKKYREEHPQQEKAASKKRREANPEKVKARNNEIGRKGGKYYDHTLDYNRTGLRGARKRIRTMHQNQYRPYKQIIAPDSQLHHEWIPETSDYRGVALVEADAHMHGFVDVIEILDGKITLLTEDEVRKGKRK